MRPPWGLAPTSPSSPTPTSRGGRGGAPALAALTGTTADRVVMHTGGVPDASLAALAARGARLVAVDLLPTSDAFNAATPRTASTAHNPFTKGDEAPLPHAARQLRQAPPLAAPLRARGVPRRRHAGAAQHRPALRLPRALRGAQRLRRPRRLPPHELGRVHRAALPGDLRPPPARSSTPPAPSGSAPTRPSSRRPSPTGTACRCIYNTLQYVWLNLPALWDWARHPRPPLPVREALGGPRQGRPRCAP